MAIISQIRAKATFGEVIIENWKIAGLLKASVIKPVIFTVEKNLIRKVLGRLYEDDSQRLRQALELIIGLLCGILHVTIPTSKGRLPSGDAISGIDPLSSVQRVPAEV